MTPCFPGLIRKGENGMEWEGGGRSDGNNAWRDVVKVGRRVQWSCPKQRLQSQRNGEGGRKQRENYRRARSEIHFKLNVAVWDAHCSARPLQTHAMMTLETAWKKSNSKMARFPLFMCNSCFERGFKSLYKMQISAAFSNSTSVWLTHLVTLIGTKPFGR